jgi:hypothetical protein
MPFVRPARGVVKNLRTPFVPTPSGRLGAQGGPLWGPRSGGLDAAKPVALVLAVLRPELWYSSRL